ncbi:MAG TPA: carboxymuconolactone decarboxylase family protein [Burkholderiales bacterium]|nr:carboxymuconolactone decarboxylase family protein [Burkholderiales bacterium]
MSRLNIVNPEVATGNARASLAAVHGALGVVPNLFRIAANSPAALEGLWHLNGALTKGRFDAKLRESIALAVAEANRCAYCLSAHQALGHGAGLSEAEVDAAREAKASDPRTRAVLELARRIVEARGDIGAPALQNAKAAGLDDADIVEAVANVAVNVFTNYLNLVADTEIDFPLAKPRATRRAEIPA